MKCWQHGCIWCLGFSSSTHATPRYIHYRGLHAIKAYKDRQYQRRQSGLKSGEGRGSGSKHFDFIGKFPKYVDFFRQFHKIINFQGKFSKNLDFFR